jgi:hypothetical protein
MKNQYLGDVKDLLKLDLLAFLASRLGLAATNVLLLTPNDSTREGRHVGYQQGKHLASIFHFLKWQLAMESRNVACLPSLFTGLKIEYRQYDRPFQQECREDYFAGIPDAWLRRSVVVLDPDIGLEQDRAYSRKAPTKYVWFDEAAGLYRRSRETVLLFYQHLARDRRKQHGLLHEKARLMSQKTGSPVLTLAASDVAFLVVEKGQPVAREAVAEYGKRHRLAYSATS